MTYLNIFETNDFSNIKSVDFKDTKIYYMDNFYKYPDLVLKHFNSMEPPVWKAWETPSKNMIDFEDRRHQIDDNRMDEIYKKLSHICGQKPFGGANLITNYTRFKKCPENNYQENYWWPHNDSGYNGIIYLNDYGDEEFEGTCLYELVNKDIDTYNRYSEHADPWTKKEYWNILLKINAKFNRFVMFEGSIFLHSMSIFDDRWFAEELKDANFRINQVLFFDRQL